MLRVADPGWTDPLDARYAKATGGRWNPPGSFGVVYLNADTHTARLNVERLFSGQPFGPEDLDPYEAPILVAADLADGEYADIVTDEGCIATGLPVSYPDDTTGQRIGHAVCQPIGQEAYDEGLQGVAHRSAAPGATFADEELAWFDRGDTLTESERWTFEDWFWGLASELDF